MNCQNCKNCNCNCNCNIRGNEEEEGEREQKKEGTARIITVSHFNTKIRKFTYIQNSLRQVSTWSFLSLFFLFVLFIHSFCFLYFFLGYSNLKLGMKWRGNGTYGSLGLGYSLA